MTRVRRVCAADADAAAMEPVRRGRGDSTPGTASSASPAGRNGARPERTGRLGRPRCSRDTQGAAMEPVRRGRGDKAEAIADAYRERMPQWSPSGEDGATRRRRRRSSDTSQAAMEPVRRGRGDGPRPGRGIRPRQPQWSPSGEDGATPSATRPSPPQPRAAMEPVRRGRGDRGAEPAGHRAGPAAMEPVRRGRGDNSPRAAFLGSWKPQWSPSGEDGATRMIPRQSGQRISRPQWSPSGEDGATPGTGRRLTAGNGRNGARPERTGRQLPAVLNAPVQGAAMEPVRRGRGDPRSTDQSQAPAASRNGARPERTGRPCLPEWR